MAVEIETLSNSLADESSKNRDDYAIYNALVKSIDVF